jgi:hypothetical protein
MFFRVIQHLLPTGAAWRTTVTKTLRKFFLGLSQAPEDARTYIDLVLLDVFPDTTRELATWEAQFGLTPAATADEATRRLALAAEWAAGGGQDPTYIQGVLQTAGFDVYVHEFWTSGPPYIARDPRSYTTPPEFGTAQCNGTDALGQAQCGDGLPGHEVDADVSQYQCDRFLQNDPHYFANKNLTDVAPPPIPDDPARWQYFLYVGAQNFPDYAEVPLERKAEFERLILKLRPLQNWIVTLIDFFGAAEVLDTEAGDAFLTEAGDEFLLG